MLPLRQTWCYVDQRALMPDCSKWNSPVGVCTVCYLGCHSVSVHIFVSYQLFDRNVCIFIPTFFEEKYPVYIGLDKALFSNKTYLYFSYFSVFVVLINERSLGEALLVDAGGMCFRREISELTWYLLLFRPLSPVVFFFFFFFFFFCNKL